MIKNPWKTLQSKIAYENPWIRVREDKVVKPDGKKGIYGVIETCGVNVVYIIAYNEKNELYLVGQYRYPVHAYSWEVPGGGADSGDLLEAAKRELWEETGLRAKDWLYAGNFAAMSGLSNEIGHVFLARTLTQTKKNKKKEDGISKVKKVRYTQIMKMIQEGKITDAQTIAAVMKAGMHARWLTTQ